tara:strand:- start:358 stop:759 length:402 start_codon:yes stop_codon:yes gene_type:complete
MQNWAAPKLNGRHVDFEIGYQSRDTGEKTACDNLVGEITVHLQLAGFTVAVNKCFKGGQIVSVHGDPENGVHSIQLEINRLLYMDEETLDYDPKRAHRVISALEGINSTIMAFHTAPEPAIGRTPHIATYMRR